MQIEITTHDIAVNQDHKEYLSDKLDSLKKYGYRMDDESTRVKVELKKAVNRTEGKHVECQITMFVPRAILRAEVHANQVAEAADLAVSKLKKQVERYTSKKHRRDTEGKWLPLSTAEGLQDILSEEYKIESKITRRKRFSHTESMHEEEAIEQMELIDHDCFIFNNQDTGRYSMLYKREDGTYGIIEPKMEGDL